MESKGFPCGSGGKRIHLQCGRSGFNPWVGRPPGEGKEGNSCLENSMDYTVRGVTRSQTRLSEAHFHFHGIQKDSTNDPTCRAAKETRT